MRQGSRITALALAAARLLLLRAGICGPAQRSSHFPPYYRMRSVIGGLRACDCDGCEAWGVFRLARILQGLSTTG